MDSVQWLASRQNIIEDPRRQATRGWASSDADCRETIDEFSCVGYCAAPRLETFRV
jgi:hypothetical protein